MQALVLYYSLIQTTNKPQEWFFIEGIEGKPIKPQLLEITSYGDAMNKIIGMCRLVDRAAHVDIRVLNGTSKIKCINGDSVTC